MLLVVTPVRAAEDVSVAPQYDSTHVYVKPADMDAFVKSFTATFGGQASAAIVSNVMPVPASTQFRYIWTPVGTLSTFAFLTPIPFPFGSERTGYLVTDMGKAVEAVHASGGEVVVAPFKDPIGMDTVVQWPGGFRTQLYWHFTPPTYQPLATVPDNRVYVSADTADQFIAGFSQFAHAKVIKDEPHADGVEIGRPGEFFRKVRLQSGYGSMLVFVTDGHSPYPFGHEVTGYEVGDLDATLARALASGAAVISQPVVAGGRYSAMLQFPGGYIAEVHQVTSH